MLARLSLVALVAVGAVTTAAAQSTAQQNQARPAPPPRPPVVIVNPNEIFRGPPAPPERPSYSPPSMSPPMERIGPPPPLTPRVGN